MAKKSVVAQRANRANKVMESFRDIHDKLEIIREEMQTRLVLVARELLSHRMASEIREAINATADIQSLYEELAEVLGNLEEKFSGTERYQRIEAQIEGLEDAKDLSSRLELPESIDSIEELSHLLDEMEDISETCTMVADGLDGVEW